jgi:glycosyltransferase involved in cell wall biosynthesis
MNQSGRNFEWILVDDLSNDGGQTRELMQKLAQEAPFEVKLVFLEQNYFAARSAYEGSRVASGELACILDHDDELAPDALKTVERLVEKFHVLGDPTLAGVTGRCLDTQGRLIGARFAEDEFIATEGDIRFRMKIPAELFQFTKTELIRTHFCEMKPGYTNGFVWARISKKFKTVYTNEAVRLYDTELETSYSNSPNQVIRFPAEKAEAIGDTLECFSDVLILNPVYSLKVSASRIRHLINGKQSLVKNRPRGFWPTVFYLAALPLGYLKAKQLI